MNLPEIVPCNEVAIDTVTSVINRAKEMLGERQTLRQLAETRNMLANQCKVTLNLGFPLAITSETFICETIEKKWRLTDVLMYTLRYRGISEDECSEYYYFEVIFSQPTIEYPIPQATASVFFRVQYKHTEPSETVPMMTFRLEGHFVDHDVRFVALIADWILAIIKMKVKFFKRILEIRLF